MLDSKPCSYCGGRYDSKYFVQHMNGDCLKKNLKHAQDSLAKERAASKKARNDIRRILKAWIASTS